jgi:hypothetical protein
MRPRILGLTAALLALGGTYALQNQLAFNPSAAREGDRHSLADLIGPAFGRDKKFGGPNKVQGQSIHEAQSGGMPDSWFNGDGEPTKVGSEGASLADTLTVERRGRVWWDYARDVSSVVSRREITSFYFLGRLRVRSGWRMLDTGGDTGCSDMPWDIR